MSHHSHHDKDEAPFSPSFFFTLMFVNVSIILGLFYLLFPKIWSEQLSVSLPMFFFTFVALQGLNSFAEWAFHRYMLHAPLVPYIIVEKLGVPVCECRPIVEFFYNLYNKHHHVHHKITDITVRKESSDSDKQIVRNIYPIVKSWQYIASYFPWYTYWGFISASLPLFILIQYFFPTAPVVLCGILGIAFSLILYELRHAADHWPDETLEKMFRLPYVGGWIKERFKFHRRHHADIFSNMGISCFFLIPIWDYVFNTSLKSKTFYKDGEEAIPSEFESPKPRFIGPLDSLAEQACEWKRDFKRVGIKV